MALTGTVQLSQLVLTDQVTSRQVTVTVNGTALPVIEGITGPVTFACNNGDLVTVVDVDVNAIGSSLPSATFSVTAPPSPIVPPTAVPTTPTIVGVTFA